MKLDTILTALVESMIAGDTESATTHFSKYALAKAKEHMIEADFGSFQAQAGRTRPSPNRPVNAALNRSPGAQGVADAGQDPVSAITFTMTHEGEGGESYVVKQVFNSQQELMASEIGRNMRDATTVDAKNLLKTRNAMIAQQLPSMEMNDGEEDETPSQLQYGEAVAKFDDEFEHWVQLVANGALKTRKPQIIQWSVETDLNWTIVVQGEFGGFRNGGAPLDPNRRM